MSIKLLSGIRFFFLAFVFSIAFCGNVLNAQVTQTARYETYLGDFDQGYEVAPAGKSGVYLYNQRIVNGSSVLNMVLLDTALQQKWRGYLPVRQNFVVVNRQQYDTTLYLLLHYINLSKNDLQIVAVHPAKGSFVQYNIQNFIPLKLVDFRVTQQAALIAGYYNNIPVIIYYDLKTLQSKIVPGLFNEQGELTQVKTYVDGSFDVLVTTKASTKKKSLLVRSYDPGAKLMRSITLHPDPDKNLIFGRSIKTSDTNEIIAGTYSNFIADVSKGIFTANIDSNGEQQIQYYNYGDLRNFFHYLSARREARIKNRIARRKIKGRKLRFNYRLLVHDIVPYHDQLILLGEAFYPHYTYSNSNAYLGALYSTRYAIFDGYYYTHAVVICFDRDGKLVWDNSFEISDVKTYSLDQFVKIDTRPDKISLLYLFDNTIRSKVIRGDSLLEDKLSQSINLKTDEEFFHKPSLSKLDDWYGHYFITYGIQRIANSVEGPKQRIFFINKIITN